MVPAQEIFSFFGNQFVQYTFASVGDELPIHSHDFDHGCIVAVGEVIAFGKNGYEKELKQGQRINFPANKPHGVRAKTAGAIILNVMPPNTSNNGGEYGRPAGTA